MPYKSRINKTRKYFSYEPFSPIQHKGKTIPRYRITGMEYATNWEIDVISHNVFNIYDAFSTLWEDIIDTFSGIITYPHSEKEQLLKINWKTHIDNINASIETTTKKMNWFLPNKNGDLYGWFMTTFNADILQEYNQRNFETEVLHLQTAIKDYVKKYLVDNQIPEWNQDYGNVVKRIVDIYEHRIKKILHNLRTTMDSYDKFKTIGYTAFEKDRDAYGDIEDDHNK